MSGSPFPQKTSTKIVQNIMTQLIYRALPEVNSSFLFDMCNCIALTIQLSKNETITRQSQFHYVSAFSYIPFYEHSMLVCFCR
jgi:hypothetical protein